MYSFNIAIANHVIQICTAYPLSSDMFEDYLSTGVADMRVNITKEELLIEPKERSKDETEKSDQKNSSCAPNLLSRVADCLAESNTILFHGASICVNDSVFIFSAPSGTGKTTHILKWLDNIQEAFAINGDKPFIITYENGNSPIVCGSPWAGKENLYTNCSAKLESIIFMQRSEINSIQQISFSEAFPFLLQQTYRPKELDKMRKVISSIKRLSGKVKFFHFYCNNYKDDCFQVAYNSLVQKA